MKKIINLTPHAVVLKNQEVELVIEPSGSVARLDFKEVTIGELNGFPVVQQELAGHNLPSQQEGVSLLVSAMVLSEARKMGRTDCFAPDTNHAERNEKGWIISVPGFVA